jgi:hypothetical protein
MSHLAQKDYSGNEGAANKLEQIWNRGLRLGEHITFEKAPLYGDNVSNN